MMGVWRSLQSSSISVCWKQFWLYLVAAIHSCSHFPVPLVHYVSVPLLHWILIIFVVSIRVRVWMFSVRVFYIIVFLFFILVMFFSTVNQLYFSCVRLTISIPPCFHFHSLLLMYEADFFISPASISSPTSGEWGRLLPSPLLPFPLEVIERGSISWSAPFRTPALPSP